VSLQTLNENLDIIQNLVIPFLEDDLDNIQKLDDEPNDVGGLSAAELKAEFDKSGNTIKEYLNETLIPQLSDTVAEAEVRATAERERVANENIRIGNENARIENEDARQENETARVNAEKARADAEAARVREEQARVDRDTGIVAQATTQANAAKTSAEQAATSVGAAAQEVTKAANQVTLAQEEVQNAKDQVSLAKQEVSNAQGKVEDAEAYAKGTRNGVAVGSSDPAYQNNAKYFADQAKEVIGPTVTPEALQEALTPINQSVSALQTRVQPINLGGTGASEANQARQNLGAAAVKEMTKAQYDALTTIDPTIFYALTDVEADGVKIEVGSYVGTGTYGSGNKNSLTFGFEPKVVIVHSDKVTDFGQYVLIWVFGSTYATNGRSAATSSATKETYVVCSFSGTTLSWHTAGTSSIYQLNNSGTTYNYVAIG
jgi:hypothetical protein